MIEPQVHQDGQRGVIGAQHGLQRLTNLLEVLNQGQAAQQQRDEQTHKALTTLGQSLARLQRGSQRLTRAVLGLAVLVLALGGVVGWQVWHPPQMQYAHALGMVDATLGQTWSTLPKATQEALSATYGRLGIPSPGERRGK